MTWGGTYAGMTHIGVTVMHLSPVANFSASPTSGTVPLTVQFKDESGGNPTGWEWKFGDGQNSTERNPVHTYAKTGNYSVSLKASSPYGSHQIQKTGYITAGKSAAVSSMMFRYNAAHSGDYSAVAGKNRNECIEAMEFFYRTQRSFRQ